MKKYAPIWISTVSLLLSVIAVCVSVWRSPELSFDYQGVIVGVLSLLVTVLIGWNIYTLVDLKGVQSKMRALSEDATKHINGNMTISEGAHFMIYHYLLTGKDPLGLEYRFIYHGVACLMNASQYGDILTCNVIVKAMLECIAHPERISVTERGKADISEALGHSFGLSVTSIYIRFDQRKVDEANRRVIDLVNGKVQSSANMSMPLSSQSQ